MGLINYMLLAKIQVKHDICVVMLASSLTFLSLSFDFRFIFQSVSQRTGRRGEIFRNLCFRPCVIRAGINDTGSGVLSLFRYMKHLKWIHSDNVV